MKEIPDRRGREREAVRAMRLSVESGNFPAFLASLEEIRATCAWRKALLMIRSLPAPPAPFRQQVLSFWREQGDQLRKEIYAGGNYLPLAEALQVLLPMYQGPPMRLWRGGTAWGRRRHVYGLAWSREKGVAQAFAYEAARRYPDGSVLLETDAPAAAIISVVPCGESHNGDKEVLVDRRQLTSVRVVARYHHYPEVTDEHQLHVDLGNDPARRLYPAAG
jgi:hypothetical protein